MTRSLCFRFDVDTHRCLTRGSAPLRAVAADAGVHFTFFVNMGRATDRRQLLRLLWQDDRSPTTQQLSSLRKLGIAGTIRVVLTNPMVGASHLDEVRNLVAAGHEVGLHGGRNHRRWQDLAPSWSAGEIAEEVTWGVDRLAGASVNPPYGFSSPGWSRPVDWDEVGTAVPFSYFADAHGHDREGVDRAGSVPEIATNILGEPGGVGYLEWMRAKGASNAQIEADFAERLSSVSDLAVVYDHPFWAGHHDSSMVRRLIDVGVAEGFRIVTMSEAMSLH